MRFLASILFCLFLVVLISCQEEPRDWTLLYHYDTETYAVVKEPFDKGFGNYQVVEDSLTFKEVSDLYHEAVKVQAFTDRAN